jgi:uncharacterized protein (DUF736 family)
MSQEYDNTNRGVLFKNDKKETDNHPDYTGSLDVDGDEFFLAAWIKTSKAGKKFMSLSVKPKGENMSKPVPAQTKRPTDFDDLPDDLPF